MIEHPIVLAEVFNTFPVVRRSEELAVRINNNAPNSPDSLMEHFEFPIVRQMGITTVGRKLDYDRTLIKASKNLPFNSEGEDESVEQTSTTHYFTRPYIGCIVSLRLPHLFAILLLQMHEAKQIHDALGFLANITVARNPLGGGMRPSYLLDFLSRYYNQEGIAQLTKHYKRFLGGLVQALRTAGLSVHAASHHWNRVGGTELLILGKEHVVALAVAKALVNYSYTVKEHPAVLGYATLASDDLNFLRYTETGEVVPSFDTNGMSHPTFGLQVLNHYRKSKLALLLAD